MIKLVRHSCLAILLLVIAACGDSDRGDETNTLHRGLGGGADSLDPHKAHSTQAHMVLDDLFQGLLEYTADGRLVEGVAERWSVSEDGLVYDFILRGDARWSDGTPVTAQDFVFSFQRLVDPETAAFYATFITNIVNAPDILSGEEDPSVLGVRAIDDHHFQIYLSQPTPYFPQLLTHAATFPLHEKSVNEHGGSFARPENLVSNGAYNLAAWVINSHMVLEKNETFWDSENVAIDRVIWYPIVDATREYDRYRAGELDITNNVSAQQFATIAEERPNELRVGPYLGLYYYGFNLTRPPFKDNAKLRQALSMAIDREILVEKITGRGEIAAYSWVPRGIEGYDSARFGYADLSRDERLDEARRLYREAGYSDENPLEFEIRYNTSQSEQNIALAAQSMWRTNLGALAKLVNEEQKVLITNIRQMQITEAFRLSWIGDYSDPHTFLQLMITGDPTNLTGYSNAEFDELMEMAANEVSAERRADYLKAAESRMLEDHPAIPIYYYVSKHLVHPKVRGWAHNILNKHPSKHLSIVE